MLMLTSCKGRGCRLPQVVLRSTHCLQYFPNSDRCYLQNGNINVIPVWLAALKSSKTYLNPWKHRRKHCSPVLRACRSMCLRICSLSPTKQAREGRQGRVWASPVAPVALAASTWADELILCETNTNSYLFGLGLAGGLTTFDNPVKGAPVLKFMRGFSNAAVVACLPCCLAAAADSHGWVAGVSRSQCFTAAAVCAANARLWE